MVGILSSFDSGLGQLLSNCNSRWLRSGESLEYPRGPPMDWWTPGVCYLAPTATGCTDLSCASVDAA